MKPVKTLQRYKCDFCKKRSVKHIIAKHEKSCYRNPKRFCDNCNNTGITREELVDPIYGDVPCRYCADFDKKMLKEIEEREAKEKKEESKIFVCECDIPF